MNLESLRELVSLGRWPQCSLAELCQVVSEFAAHQERHRDFLCAYGLPPVTFPDAPWVDRRLGLLYVTRMSDSPLPVTAVVGLVGRPRRRKRSPPSSTPAGSTRPNIPTTKPGRCKRSPPPPYRWVRLQPHPEPKGDGCFGEAFARETSHWVEAPTYLEASLLNGLDRADAERIERDRPALFRFKVATLGLIVEASSGRDRPAARAAALRDGWLELVDQQLGPDGLRFYLRLDRYYRGDDACLGYSHGPTSIPHAGGLSDLIDLAGEVEWELVDGGTDELWRELSPAVLTAVVTERASLADIPHLREAVAAAEVAWRRRTDWMAEFRGQVLASLQSKSGGEAGVFWPPDPQAVAELGTRYVESLVARASQGLPLDSPHTPSDRPQWNARSRKLWYRERVLATYRRYGKDYPGLVLAELERDEWRAPVIAPSGEKARPLGEERLKNLVKSLNKPLEGAPIRFHIVAGKVGWTTAGG